MRQVAANQSPSIVRDIGALAGLYRTVFWMIGRKSQYGRIWPPEAEMGPADETVREPPVITVAETTRHATVEIGTRD